MSGAPVVGCTSLEIEILLLAETVLRDMEREGATCIMTVNGPVSPAVARQMLASRRNELEANALAVEVQQ